MYIDYIIYLSWNTEPFYKNACDTRCLFLRCQSNVRHTTTTKRKLWHFVCVNGISEHCRHHMGIAIFVANSNRPDGLRALSDTSDRRWRQMEHTNLFFLGMGHQKPAGEVCWTRSMSLCLYLDSNFVDL